MILVDSSVWIDFFAPSPGRAGAELRRMTATAEPFALAGIIVTEVLQGLTRDIPHIEAFLSKWPILEPNGIATYREAATLFRIARSKGVSLSTIDTLIAAIAFEYGARVFTLDTDFARLSKLTGLPLYNPPLVI
ncbi:MAG: type II toxin-antitoxin system VapC family toxin [Candidatus Acidiferrales bacterium]